MKKSTQVKIMVGAFGLTALVVVTVAVLVMMKKQADTGAPQVEHAEGAVVAAPQLPTADAIAILRDPHAPPQRSVGAVTALAQHAKAGDSEAMFLLALALKGGIAGETDLAGAFEWTQKSAQNGHPPAMLAMASYYEEGVWVEQSEADADAWREKSIAADPALKAALSTIAHGPEMEGAK